MMMMMMMMIATLSVCCLWVEWSGVVCLSVGLSVMTVSHAKTTETTEILFGVLIQVGPR